MVPQGARPRIKFHPDASLDANKILPQVVSSETGIIIQFLLHLEDGNEYLIFMN